MTQPSGDLTPGIPAEQSFYLRASPVICAADALTVLAQFIQLSIKTRRPCLAIRHVSRVRIRSTGEAEATRNQLQNLQENNVFRIILFVFGVVPQVVKLYACSGIPGTQALASLYLISWTILEIFVVTPARHSINGRSYGIFPIRANVNPTEHLIALLCYVAIHYSDFMALYGLHVAFPRPPPSRQPPYNWFDHPELTLVEIVYLIFLLPRVASDNTLEFVDGKTMVEIIQIMEWVMYAVLLFVVMRSGRGVEIVWLVSLRIGRLISVIGLASPPVTDNTFSMSYAKYPRMTGVAFFLTQVLTAVGYLCLKYDPLGTSKPAWTNILG